MIKLKNREKYLEMCPPVDEDVTIPLEVSKLCNLDGKSLVRAWREYKGLTQLEVAGRMGVSRAAYAQMEAPDSNPRYSTLKRLAKALGVEVDQLRG